jgi:hypothetical protein
LSFAAHDELAAPIRRMKEEQSLHDCQPLVHLSVCYGPSELATHSHGSPLAVMCPVSFVRTPVKVSSRRANETRYLSIS